MYNLWPLIIITLTLLAIAFIIFRHFPALAVLDSENIPEEKERRIKEKIIRDRMQRKFRFLENFFQKAFSLLNKVSEIFWSKLEKIRDQKKEARVEKTLAESPVIERIKIIFSTADEYINQEDWVEAEKKLIEIISLDDKNFLAFSKLGKVYQEQEKWQEAKQTLLYAVKLAELFPDNIVITDFSNLNYSLALINQELNDVSGAMFSLSKALEIDPNNPRYLDLMLNLCIMKKDKKMAEEFLDKIKKANPQNNNISDWEKEVSEME